MTGADAGALEVSCREVRQLLDDEQPVALIDCRREEEWETCRLEGALHVPLDELLSRADEVREVVTSAGPGATIVVYCHHGRRSLTAARLLRTEGIEALSMRGGIDQWSLEIDPGIERY